MRTPDNRGIIGPSQADIAAADNTPRGPIRKSRVLTAVGAALGLGTPLLISACASPQRPAEVRSVSTPTAEPVYTPVAIGVSLPAECQTDPNAVKGWDITTSKRPLTAADNPYIDALNACVLQANKSAEATATAIATTKPAVAPAAEPTRAATSTPEAKQGFDCGILSPEACAEADYIQWDTPFGNPAEAIAMAFKAGKKFKIPEPMQVAAAEETYQGKPNGYRIVAARKDGSQIIIDGDVIPVGIGKVGKELPAGTVIAESAESGFPVLIEGYTQFIQFTSKEDLKKYFPKQTEIPPRIVINKAIPPSQSNTKGGGGVVFFGVQPPQSN